MFPILIVMLKSKRRAEGRGPGLARRGERFPLKSKYKFSSGEHCGIVVCVISFKCSSLAVVSHSFFSQGRRTLKFIWKGD